jgi:hypothetical protein
MLCIKRSDLWLCMYVISGRRQRLAQCNGLNTRFILFTWWRKNAQLPKHWVPSAYNRLWIMSKICVSLVTFFVSWSSKEVAAVVWDAYDPHPSYISCSWIQNELRVSSIFNFSRIHFISPTLHPHICQRFYSMRILSLSNYISWLSLFPRACFLLPYSSLYTTYNSFAVFSKLVSLYRYKLRSRHAACFYSCFGKRKKEKSCRRETNAA